MSAFAPAAFIAQAEAAGARLLLLYHDDGSLAVSTSYGYMNWDKMPAEGITGDQLRAVGEELWEQGKFAYAGPAPRRHRA